MAAKKPLAPETTHRKNGTKITLDAVSTGATGDNKDSEFERY